MTHGDTDLSAVDGWPRCLLPRGNNVRWRREHSPSGLDVGWPGRAGNCPWEPVGATQLWGRWPGHVAAAGAGAQAAEEPPPLTLPFPLYRTRRAVPAALPATGPQGRSRLLRGHCGSAGRSPETAPRPSPPRGLPATRRRCWSRDCAPAPGSEPASPPPPSPPPPPPRAETRSGGAGAQH